MSNNILNVIPVGVRIQEKINFPSSNNVKKYYVLFLPFLILASAPLALAWQLPWNKAETQSQQQQQKWLHKQQDWKQQNDPRVMERKMRDEHQKWQREMKKREKAALKFLKPSPNACKEMM